MKSKIEKLIELINVLKSFIPNIQNDEINQLESELTALESEILESEQKQRLIAKFPDCAKGCNILKELGAGECESVCPDKFKERLSAEEILKQRRIHPDRVKELTGVDAELYIFTREQLQEYASQRFPSEEEMKDYLLDNYKPFMIDDLDANEHFRECALICMQWVIDYIKSK